MKVEVGSRWVNKYRKVAYYEPNGSTDCWCYSISVIGFDDEGRTISRCDRCGDEYHWYRDDNIIGNMIPIIKDDP